MIARTAMLSLFTFLAGLVFVQTSAHADASCSTLLSQRLAQSNPRLGWEIELSMHREDVAFVSYAFGVITNDGRGELYGRATQLFSDREIGYQPFDKDQDDELTIALSPTGLPTSITAPGASAPPGTCPARARS